MTPPEKAEAVRKARSEGSVLLMVGDGINDAPALTEADVGLAMGRGTDIALESADAVLMNDNLLLVPRFLAISRNTMRVITSYSIHYTKLYEKTPRTGSAG